MNRIVRRGFGSVPRVMPRWSARAISSSVPTPLQLSFAPGVAIVSNACAT
jgi:hypothetical protein